MVELRLRIQSLITEMYVGNNQKFINIKALVAIVVCSVDRIISTFNSIILGM